MKSFIKFLSMFFADNRGMTSYEGDNYAGAYSTEPLQKYPPGELGGEVKAMFERFTLVAADGTGAIAQNDTIKVGKLPKNSFVVDAMLRINKSLGATGQFILGHGASTDEDGNTINADTDGFCPACDAGGQAALSRSDSTSLSLGKRFGEEEDIIVTCSEATDASVDDGVLEVAVFYVNK